MELRPPCFCAAVARTDNFTRAAAACHVSQPSLSQQIIKLEDEVGAGKTTTLAALVSELNEQREDHIITVEDPIEVVQTPKGRSAGHEILLQHEALPNTIRSGQIANIRGIIESSANDGMITMDNSLMARVKDGTVEAKEAYMKGSNKALFAPLLKPGDLDPGAGH